jgi:hypothetical protein
MGSDHQFSREAIDAWQRAQEAKSAPHLPAIPLTQMRPLESGWLSRLNAAAAFFALDMDWPVFLLWRPPRACLRKETSLFRAYLTLSSQPIRKTRAISPAVTHSGRCSLLDHSRLVQAPFSARVARHDGCLG